MIFFFSFFEKKVEKGRSIFIFVQFTCHSSPMFHKIDSLHQRERLGDVLSFSKQIFSEPQTKDLVTEVKYESEQEWINRLETLSGLILSFSSMYCSTLLFASSSFPFIPFSSLLFLSFVFSFHFAFF